MPVFRFRRWGWEEARNQYLPTCLRDSGILPSVSAQRPEDLRDLRSAPSLEFRAATSRFTWVASGAHGDACRIAEAAFKGRTDESLEFGHVVLGGSPCAIRIECARAERERGKNHASVAITRHQRKVRFSVRRPIDLSTGGDDQYGCDWQSEEHSGCSRQRIILPLQKPSVAVDFKLGAAGGRAWGRRDVRSCSGRPRTDAKRRPSPSWTRIARPKTGVPAEPEPVLPRKPSGHLPDVSYNSPTVRGPALTSQRRSPGWAWSSSSRCPSSPRPSRLTSRQGIGCTGPARRGRRCRRSSSTTS
jgi:hypothetical protein